MSDGNGPSVFKVHEIMIGRTRFPSNVLMAPLAGYTCFPFRLMAKRLGAGSAYTEMVSADALKYNDRATSKLLYTDEREKVKCVQLLGFSLQSFSFGPASVLPGTLRARLPFNDLTENRRRVLEIWWRFLEIWWRVLLARRRVLLARWRLAKIWWRLPTDNSQF